MEGPETDRPPGQNIHIQDFEGGSFMQESGHKRRPSQLVRSQTNPKQNDRLVEEIASELEIESPDNIRF
jgi:hypothetical protein